MRTDSLANKRAVLLERVAADLRDPRHADGDPGGHERLCAAFSFIFEGESAELTPEGLAALRRLVPRGRLPRRALIEP